MFVREAFIATAALELRRQWQRYLHGQRTKRSRKRRMRAILQALGGACSLCGETSDLTVDHINGQRDYDLRKLSSSHRVTVYARELKLGLLRCLCRQCNSKDARQREAARNEVPF